MQHIDEFDNVAVPKSEVTLKRIFDEYFEMATKKFAKSTLEKYNLYYGIYFQPIAHLNYNRVSTIFLQKLFDDIETHSPHVADVCLKMAKSAANYCKKHNMITENIFSRISKIKIPDADINHLTADELIKVLDVCQKEYPKYFAMLYTFVGTGMREGEVFALTRNDFLPEIMGFRVTKQFTNKELKPHTKTKESRITYIFEDLAEIIKEHINSMPANQELLFVNSIGGYINANNLRRRFWKPLLKKCGITKRVRLHDLRGSYIDLCLSRGLSVKFAQNNVGHKKSETTLDIYARNNSDMIDSALNTLNSVFKKCEHNVSINENTPNKKIIQFPKKLGTTGL